MIYKGEQIHAINSQIVCNVDSIMSVYRKMIK